MATSIDVVVFKCREFFSHWKSVKSCVIYLTKFSPPPSNCRYFADRAENLPGLVPNIWLTLFPISSKSVHFRRSYNRTRDGGSFAPWSIDDDDLLATKGQRPLTYRIIITKAWFASNTFEANNYWHLLLELLTFKTSVSYAILYYIIHDVDRRNMVYL